MFFRLFLFELLGYNGNNGHVFTKKPDLAFWVLTAISGIKFYFFKKFFLGFAVLYPCIVGNVFFDFLLLSGLELEINTGVDQHYRCNTLSLISCVLP